MGLRRRWLVVVAVLLPAAARAGDHKFDVFLAGSYLRAPGSTINLGGWHVSGAATPLAKHRSFGLVADLSLHFLGGEGTDSKENVAEGQQADLIQTTLMVGPRWTPLGGDHKRHHMPFVHVMLLGVTHRAGGTHPGGTSAALTPGFGYDWAPGPNKTWGTRIQVDYVWPVSSDMKHSWRFSLGGVYRIRFHE